ncbi:MAG: CPBP family intramembrane glutamic endopeptidase [Pseudomonadota bacterium]
MTTGVIERRRHLRLWLEFTLLYFGIPLGMLMSFGLYSLFPVLLALAALAAFLLMLTPGWRWRELREGGFLRHWRMLLGFTLIAATAIAVLVLTLRPGSFLAFPRGRPEMWMFVMVAYPIVSALPQELIFRPLFFRRYGVLFPDARVAVAMNGAVFGFGHLFYQNPIAIGLSFLGGAVIGWAYHRTGSFPLAWALHAIAGMLIFTLGLNWYFYHGVVPR